MLSDKIIKRFAEVMENNKFAFNTPIVVKLSLDNPSYGSAGFQKTPSRIEFLDEFDDSFSSEAITLRLAHIFAMFNGYHRSYVMNTYLTNDRKLSSLKSYSISLKFTHERVDPTGRAGFGILYNTDDFNNVLDEFYPAYKNYFDKSNKLFKIKISKTDRDKLNEFFKNSTMFLKEIDEVMLAFLNFYYNE
jgi:hypothetical protein